MRYLIRCSVIALGLGLGAPALAQHHGGGHGGGHGSGHGGGHARGGHSGGGHIGSAHAGRGHGSFSFRRHGHRSRHRGRVVIGLGFGSHRYGGFGGYGGYYSRWPYPIGGGYGRFGLPGSGWRMLEPELGMNPLLRDWVMLRFDANGNGRLGRHEARAANEAFWALADPNRDGSTSDEEWTAARQAAERELEAEYGPPEPPPPDTAPPVSRP